MFLQAQNAKFFVRGVGGWGYVNVSWTCKDGWMLYNRCWRNVYVQLYVAIPIVCRSTEFWSWANWRHGSSTARKQEKLGAFYRTLVLIKTKRNWYIYIYIHIEISVNKLPARPYVKNFQVGQWFSPLLIIYSVFARKCSMRFHAAKDMDDALSIGRFVEILLLDKKCQQLLDLIVFCFKRYVANFFVSLFLWLIIIWRQIKASPDVLNTSSISMTVKFIFKQCAIW